jgi:spore coat protein U-like protein
MMKRATMSVLLTLLTLCGAHSALAVVSCSATTTGIAFGIYNPLSAAPANSTGSIAVNCTLLSGPAVNDAVTVYLTTGSSASYAARSMVSGAAALNYNIYFSAAYQQIWGNGTGGSYYGVATLPMSPGAPTATATGTFYGQIAALQDVTPGSYADTIVVTVNY